VSVLSDSIEMFIKEMMKQTDEIALQRNELAQYFSCAPSQINYVLSTRFTPDRGYLIISRRGGGGYIRITRVDMDRDSLLHDMLTNQLSARLPYRQCEGMLLRLKEENIISDEIFLVVSDLLRDVGLPSNELQDHVRAHIMKNFLLKLLKEA